MKSRYLNILLLLVAALLASACGGDEGESKAEAVTPPDNPKRALPAYGPPEGEHQAPDVGFAEGDAEVPEGTAGGDAAAAECCPVRFALADPYDGADEIYVRLHGTFAPILDESGIDLSFADGEWSTTACVPVQTAGNYHYEVALPTDTDGEYFVDTHVNEYVNTTSGPEGLANRFVSANSCEELDAAVHSKTSE